MHNKTKVFMLSQSLMATVLMFCPGDVTGQFAAATLACPDSTFTFRCTVNGNMRGVTIWRVNGSSECPLPHRSTSSSICGLGNAFTARSGTGFGTSDVTSYTSTLSGTANPALNGTLVECFGPANNIDPGNRVDGSILQIIGPPSVPSLSCLGLSQNVSGAVNVTVSWTLSGGDNADFYLINITTNAPHTPYEGLLNITNASVTQYQLTSFMADYEYNLTVRGVNCGSQEGGESEPLTITPQIPAAPGSCNIALLYGQSSRRLQFIDTTWDLMSEPEDQLGACQGPRGHITHYQIRFQVGSAVLTDVNVNISACTTERCSNTFNLSNVPSGRIPSSYDSVSVAAINAVGMGAARTCTSQSISTTNNLLSGGMVDVSSPDDATIICTFLCGFTGSTECTVHYGTDPTYMNLPYSAESSETGTAGEFVSVMLRDQLNSSTEYYYTVSAVRENVTVTVQRNFTTPQYSVNCSPMELWNLSASEATFLPDISLLNDAAARYPSCDTRHVGSAALKDTTLNTATVAYYSGTTPGSTACFVCDETNGYDQSASMNMRVCQSNATWSNSPIVCICTQSRLLEWHIALIVLGAVSVVVSLVLTIILVAISMAKFKDQMSPVNHCITYGHLVCATILCLLGGVLLIAVGGVVSNPPNGNVCDPGWSRRRDALIISGFLSSILSFILLFTSLFIHLLLSKYCPDYWTKQPERKENIPMQKLQGNNGNN